MSFEIPFIMYDFGGEKTQNTKIMVNLLFY